MENKELLYDLYRIYSPSRGEKRLKKFVKNYIRTNIPGVEITHDNVGNIYAKKGAGDSFPCVVSHLDQVQKVHESDFMCIEVEGKVFGFSPKSMEMRGLGADDKNGVWVCLQCLAKFDNIKCAFFVGEEIGCVGSSDADMKFFEDCRFVLQCDRRNGHDLITSIWGDLCSEEFLADTDFKDFGYKETDGLSTDVGTLKDNGLKVSCVNMSCGYYAPHTDEEYTDLSELQHCLDFVCHIIGKCTKVYPHEGSSYKWGGNDYDWDDLFARPYGGYGGYTAYGPKQPIKVAESSGKHWGWNERTHSYEWVDDEPEEDIVNQDEIDDINSEIYDCCLNGMEDKDIITDIQYFFPYYDSPTIQGMIDDVRRSFDFRQYS